MGSEMCIRDRDDYDARLTRSLALSHVVALAVALNMNGPCGMQLLGARGGAGSAENAARSLQPASARNDAPVQAGEKEAPQC